MSSAGEGRATNGEGGARKLGFLQYLGYGIGDAANNLTFMMASSFLLIYYTDVAGIPAAAAGTLFLAVRVWGGITDLFAGRRVDATSTRWGKFRPYLLFVSLPLLATLVAMFTVPGGWSVEAKLVYAYATYALFQLLYSFVNIPYGSLAAAMTQVSDERSRLSSYRMVFTSLTILLLAIVISPQIEGSENLQRSLTITTLVFVAVGMAFYLFTFFTAREQVERSVETAGLRDILSMLRQNGPLIVLCLSCLLFLTGMFSMQAVAVYYARDVLGNANLYIVMSVVGTVAMIVASMLVPVVARALGKKRAYILGGLIAVAGGIAMAFAPGSIPALGIACYGVLNFGIGVVNDSVRMNEGGCDPDGRFYCGSMAYDQRPGAASLYRLDPDLSVRVVLQDVTVSNGLEWSPDGSRAYYNDTATYRTDVFDYGGESGLNGRRPFVDLSAEAKRPDGLTVDEQGGVWMALSNGGAVRRYAPDGALDEVVEVPARKVTACTFGGPDLDQLFITSREGLDPGDDPLAGSLFWAAVGVSGLPVREFAG